MSEYSGRHERTADWQKEGIRYFGKHERRIPADDAKGYIPPEARVQRIYGMPKQITVRETRQRRRAPGIREALGIADPDRVRRAIPADGIVKPYSPIWEKTPQAAYWLMTGKRRRYGRA